MNVHYYTHRKASVYRCSDITFSEEIQSSSDHTDIAEIRRTAHIWQQVISTCLDLWKNHLMELNLRTNTLCSTAACSETFTQYWHRFLYAAALHATCWELCVKLMRRECVEKLQHCIITFMYLLFCKIQLESTGTYWRALWVCSAVLTVLEKQTFWSCTLKSFVLNYNIAGWRYRVRLTIE